MSVSYVEFQQQRGRLPDLIEEALSIYDEFMKDDAYDAQRPLDKIAEKLRSARDFYDAKHRSTSTSTEEVERLTSALKLADDALCEYACHLGEGVPCARSADQCASECGKQAGDALLTIRAALTGASNHVG